MSEVQLREIEKSFSGVPLLRHLDLLIQSGQYVVLLGPSGCGKTTILKMIAGLEEPDSGEILIGRHSGKSIPSRKRDIAMVFQQDALYPHLTVRQSLAFALQAKLGVDALRDRIAEASRLAGIDAILDRYPNSLSGGESRRAAVAKAIVRGASIRLLDEPLSALDAPTRHSLQKDLLQWHATAGGTTLHVTHDGHEAMRMADKIAVMQDGRVMQMGSPDEVYFQPATRAVALAIGSPPINLVPAERASGQLRFSEPEIHIQGDLSSRIGDVTKIDVTKIDVGIRPEAFRLIDNNDSSVGIRFDAIIERIQAVNGEHQIELLIGTRRVTAVLPSGTAPPQRDRCQWLVDAELMHLFDAGDGRVLSGSSDG